MFTQSRTGFFSLVLCALIGLSAAARFCPSEKRIGAMPDAIKTVRRKNPGALQRVFPKVDGEAVTEPYFQQWAKQCDAAEANDKCYLLFDQRKTDSLDSCEETIGNLEGKDTIGNQLCDQAKRFLEQDGQFRKGISNVAISFYSSTCSGGWNPVTSSSAGALSLQ